MITAPHENCLLGKVIADNHIVHKQYVVLILCNTWKNHNPVTMSPWKNNFIKIAFENKEDIPKILRNAPWSVMGYYVALVPWDSNKTLNELDFNRDQFWIQAHDLPLGMLSSEYAREITKSSGILIELDCVGEGPQTDRDFPGFRVEIDITKPLVPGLFITRSEGKESWVSFIYERLSEFCHRCGCLGYGRDSYTNEALLDCKHTSSLPSMAMKSIILLSLLVIVFASSQAEAQLVFGSLVINGTLYCSLNGNIVPNAATPTPAFANALVQVRYGGNVVASDLTDPAIFQMILNPPQFNVSRVLSTCLLVVNTPVASCNASLPVVGALQAALHLVRTDISGLVSSALNLVPTVFQLTGV